MSHLDDGLIQELLDGEVPSAALAPIQAHLASCAECATRLAVGRDFAATSDEMIGWLDDEPNEAPVLPITAPDHLRGRRLARWPQDLAWAASLVLAVGLGYAARGGVAPAAPIPVVPIAVPVLDQQAPVASDKAASDRATAATELPPSGANESRSATRAPAAAEPPERQPPRFGAEPTAAERPMASVAQKAAEAEASTEQDELSPARREQRVAVPTERQRNSLAAGATAAPAPQPVAQDRANAKVSETQATLDTVGTPVGMVFRIEGLDLLRTVIAVDVMRLVYAHPDGEVTLVQRRVGDQVAWHLEVPTGFPASVLRELATRVK